MIPLITHDRFSRTRDDDRTQDHVFAHRDRLAAGLNLDGDVGACTLNLEAKNGKRKNRIAPLIAGFIRTNHFAIGGWNYKQKR